MDAFFHLPILARPREPSLATGSSSKRSRSSSSFTSGTTTINAVRRPSRPLYYEDHRNPFGTYFIAQMISTVLVAPGNTTAGPFAKQGGVAAGGSMLKLRDVTAS